MRLDKVLEYHKEDNTENMIYAKVEKWQVDAKDWFLRLYVYCEQAKEMVLVVQKEVGQRICAKPPKMSILAVSVQFYAKPKIISYISKKSFWPQPKVDSAIMKISNIRNQKSKKFKNLFFKVVKVGFSHPRKQLINNLSRGLKMEREKVKNWLFKNKIKPKQRAETLIIKDWLNLTKSLKYNNGKVF